MTVTYGFFDKQADGVTDASYTEDQGSIVFGAAVPDGVQAVPGDIPDLVAISSDGSGVTVAVCRIFADGFFCDVTAAETLAVGAAAASTRLDRVVARLDRAANTFLPYVNPGTPGSVTPPPLVDDSTIKDIPLGIATRGADGSLTVTIAPLYQALGIEPTTSAGQLSGRPYGFEWQTDTSKLIIRGGDGTRRVLIEDSGYTAIRLDTTHFSQGGVPLEVARINRWISLTGQVTCKITGNDAFGIGWLPDWATPRKSTPITAYGEGGEPIEVLAYASGDRKGQVWVVGNVAAIAVKGRDLVINASWPALP